MSEIPELMENAVVMVGRLEGTLAPEEAVQLARPLRRHEK
jgi:hypothetical protein